MPIHRGEIYYVDLDPTSGREIRKRRPAVVLSINDINRKPLVVTVVPGTDAAHEQRAFRNVVIVQPDAANGLSKPTNFMCHQLRAVDHCRFSPRALGRIAPQDLMRIEAATRYCLGLVQ